MNLQKAEETAILTRYISGQKQGHYESFFLRANHPERPLAFWIRYTIFSPENYPDNAVGELWAICFNGETGTHTAVKKEVPLSECTFARDRLDVNVDGSTLKPGILKGNIINKLVSVEWDLAYSGIEKPVFWFPVKFYSMNFPRAKGLVSLPMARFNGALKINSEEINIDGWVGSENHNWGLKHTDHYAWGQVAEFDNSSHSFLELATARIKLGFLWSPFLTPVVFRHEGIEYNLNQLYTAFFRASFTYFDWHFKAHSKDIDLHGIIHGERSDFVCLKYNNPPGGTKFCLNSKIASCDLYVTIKKTGRQYHLVSKNRAAFEILTDNDDHGLVPAV